MNAPHPRLRRVDKVTRESKIVRGPVRIKSSFLSFVTMREDAITSSCLTIGQMADHFSQLRRGADAMVETVGAGECGYFTPTQDVQIRRLMVSYWQSRKALMELIQQVRSDERSPDDASPAAFLIAYAAAVLLVDAARYLRRTFHDRPMVVAKLNEPEPYFGIPAGAYDSVQKSLTDPVHAWHLYHAHEFFHDHHDDLGRLATRDDRLAPVWAVIEQRGQALHVSRREYAKARLKVRSHEISENLGRLPRAAAMYRLQTIACRLVAGVHVLPLHRPRLPRQVGQRLRTLLHAGDVMIVRKEYAVTNYFLPGYWPHAALYLGDLDTIQRVGLDRHEHVKPRWQKLVQFSGPDDHRVLEAMKDGVHIRSIQSPLQSDAIVVIRPKLGQPEIVDALGRALFHEGKPYDFDFDFTRSDRLVCTEVIYRAYEGVGDVRFQLTRRSGRLTLSAEDLLHMALRHQHFEPVAVYAPDYRKRLQTGEDARTALQVTLQSP